MKPGDLVKHRRGCGIMSDDVGIVIERLPHAGFGSGTMLTVLFLNSPYGDPFETVGPGALLLVQAADHR